MTKTIPLRSRFLKFYFRERLGQRVQKDLAVIVQCSERVLSTWFNGAIPSDQSLMDAVLGTRDKLGLPFEGGHEDGNDLIGAYHFIREIEKRSASPDDPIPASLTSFLRKQKLVDAQGEPTDKLIKWLNSAPPPLVAPRYISREQAFTESEVTSAIWLNPHNHYSLPLVGRDAELALLDEFIGSKERFKIAALVAPSGAGKTRLVSQWAKPYIVGDKSTEWDAGFVESPDADRWREESWQPTKNTLIIIDYTYNYADVIGAILKRFEDGAPHDIRLLVLDHVLPEKLHLDTAFRKGVPSLGFREANSELFFETWPIALKPISDTQGFLREIISAAADPFTEGDHARRYKPDSPEVTSAASALMKIGAVQEATATPDEIKRRDAVRHPLFAALLGQMIRRNPDSEFSGMTRRDLVGHYFENERRLPWSDDAQDPTLGYWVGLYVSAATLLRGIAINDILEFEDDPPETTEPVLNGRDFKKLRDICGRFVSSGDQQVIQPFEPDILGETFVLKFLAERQTGTDYRALASLLNLCCQSGQFKDPVGSFLKTTQRLVRNLINDDQELKEVKEAWNSLDWFLRPKWFPAGTRMRFALPVALGNALRQLKQSDISTPSANFLTNMDLIDLNEAQTKVNRHGALLSMLHFIDSEQISCETAEDVGDLVDAFLQDVKSAGISPLVQSVAEGTLFAAQYIYGRGIESVDTTDIWKWNPLTTAALFDRFDIAHWLLDYGADPKCPGPYLGRTPIMIASEFSHPQLVYLFCEYDHTLMRSFDYTGKNAIMLARENSNKDCLGLLRHYRSLHENPLNVRINEPLFDGSQDFFSPMWNTKWFYLNEEELAEFTDFLSFTSINYLLEIGVLVGARYTYPSCYRGLRFYEMVTVHLNSEETHIEKWDSYCFVIAEDEPVIYNGTLDQVRIISNTFGLQINSSTALDYFAMAAFPIRDIESRVRFVACLNDLELFSASVDECNALAKKLVHPRVEGTDDVGVIVSGTILFGSSIHQAVVRIGFDGDIEFSLGQPFEVDGTMYCEQFIRGRRSFCRMEVLSLPSRFQRSVNRWA